MPDAPLRRCFTSSERVFDIIASPRDCFRQSRLSGTTPRGRGFISAVNDSVIRLGVMRGEYHWHKHDNDDEFFFVLDGHFIIDLEDRSIDLQPWEGFVVPKGVLHRPRAPERAVILMVEPAAIIPTGDA